MLIRVLPGSLAALMAHSNVQGDWVGLAENHQKVCMHC